MKSHSCEQKPFIIYVKLNGNMEKIATKAVIDVTGTWITLILHLLMGCGLIKS